METQRKKRKLMSSRSVPGSTGTAVVGCGVLISTGSSSSGGGGDGGSGGGSVGVGVGGSDASGGDEGGGVTRGVGATATVRGRTLPRTGHRASATATATAKEEGIRVAEELIGAKKKKEFSATVESASSSSSSSLASRAAIRANGNVNGQARTATTTTTGAGDAKRIGPRYTRLRKTQVFNRRQDQDKENAVAGIGRGTINRSAKRAREKEGDGTNQANEDSSKPELPHIHPPRVTALRMAKNAGESRIPLPGAIRASFLPKPRVVSQQQKVTTVFENTGTPQQSPSQRGSVKSIVESLNLGGAGRAPISSTPFVEGKVHQLFNSVSPVDKVSYEDIGKPVSVGEEKIGILRYYGALEGEIGAWCGIELPKPEGLNDGTVRGLKYFSCPKDHGIMAPATKVRSFHDGQSTPPHNDETFSTSNKLCEMKTSGPNSTFVAGKMACEDAISLQRIGSVIPGTKSKFLGEKTGRPESDFSRLEGDWKFSAKSTPNTSPVAPSDRQLKPRAGETNDNKLLITNETRLLSDKNKRNSSLGGPRSENEGSKTPSPTSRTKIPFGSSRLVSPTKYAKVATKIGESNAAKTRMSVSSQDIVDTEQPKSEEMRTTGLASGEEKKDSPEKVAVDDTEEKVNDATYIAKEEALLAEIKKPETATGEFANSKPTGAIFTLNESFINEKPMNGNQAANLTAILYTERSPVNEIPFSRRQTYLCGDNTLLGMVKEPPTKIDTTFDKPDVSSGSGKIAMNDTFLIGENNGSFSLGERSRRKTERFSMRDISAVEEPFSDTFVVSNGTAEPAKPIDGTFLLASDENRRELNDTFFVAPSAERRGSVISGSGIFNAENRDSIGFANMFNDSELVDGQIKSITDSCLIDDTATSDFDNRSSIGHFVDRAFSESKDALIDAVGNSCLIDVTMRADESANSEDLMNDTVKAVAPRSRLDLKENTPAMNSDVTSGPYSLLGLNGAEDEDELTPPAAPPPSKATPAPHYLMLNKQNSFEHDESLGILTPDQMAEFSMALECSRTPSCENLTGSAGSRIAITRASASRPSDLPTSVDGEPTEGSSERTPSPEDLPLDPKPAEPARTVPVSFVTSVTSITSLEAGYQGDGENSRPASRGADPAPVAPPPNLPAPRNDPMTDSDFFTESDADAHEEIGRGDRRAQVIDGTLFCAPGGRRCPSFTGEEMDSSGIYSDLDRRQDDPPNEEARSEGQTPDTADTESQKSQSSSPYKQEVGQQLQQPVVVDNLQPPMSNLDTSADSNTSAGTMEATVIEVESQATPAAKVLNKTDPVPLKKYKMPKRNVVSKIKAMIESGPKDESEKEARRPQRTPRKGGRWDAVMSKIEAGKNEQRSRPARKEVKSRVLQNLGGPAPSTANRRSPGDSAKSKRRTRGVRQDVTSPTQETAQSSVHSSMSDISSAPRSAKKRLGSPGGSEGSALGSAQSTPRISSPRQHQPPPSSLTIVNSSSSCVPSNVNGNNANNTPASLAPINSNNNNNNNNNIINSHNNNNNNNHNNQQNTTRIPPSHSQRSPTAVTPPRRPVNGRNNQQQANRVNCTGLQSDLVVKKNSIDVSRVNLEKSPSTARKPAVPRRSTSNVTPKTQSNNSVSLSPKDRGPKDISTTPAARGPAAIETREQAHQTDPTHEEIHLKQAEVSVQALSVIVQYLAHQLDGFSAPRLKKDCERMKTQWLEARLEAEELRAGYRRVEQQLNEHHDERQRAIDQLRAELESLHASRISDMDTALEAERKSWSSRLECCIINSTKELEETIARLRSEHEADLYRREAETDRRSAVHDQGAALRAEAESLRTVLELRSQEIASLRAENDGLRRELEAKEGLEAKVESLEARSEDLRAQLQRKETFERQLSHENKVLLESFHQESKQNKRLSQHNEELQWRLRQNNEVVTVLANQLATPPQRLTRSLGPESNSPDDSPPASPMVKSMVEKSDSVSWILEIEESPEAMASRLLRRSGSSRGISPSDSRPKRPRQPSSSSSPVGGVATSVSRQSSLRTSAPQRAVVLRTRSKSVSVADAMPQQQIEGWTPPGFSSTPVNVARRRPRSDPAGSTAVVSVQETSPGLRPQEAGGEAMISEETSASSSEDESSASSDIPRLVMELSWSESEG